MDRAKAEVSVNANNHGGACVHRLFVGGIPKESTEQSMRPLMEQFGTIASINLVPDTMNSALCRGYAFVDYVNPADAQKAINALNGQPYGGYTLKVQHSSQSRSWFSHNSPQCRKHLDFDQLQQRNHHCSKPSRNSINHYQINIL